MQGYSNLNIKKEKIEELGGGGEGEKSCSRGGGHASALEKRSDDLGTK